MASNVRILREGDGKYVLEIYGEDHTMGLLLAEAIKKVSNPELAYYEMSHPMEDIVMVYVKYRGEVDIKEVIAKALDYILELNSEFRRRLLEALEKGGAEVEV